MRRKAIFVLAAFIIVGASFVGGVVVERHFPWLYSSEPSPPKLVSPVDGEILPNGQGTPALPFTWDFFWSAVPRAERYEVIVDNSFNAQLGNKAGVDTSWYRAEFSAGAIDKLDGWTWKVRARVSGQWSPWSEPRAFRLEPAQKDKRPPWHVVLWLPRFNGKSHPTHEEILEAVKDVPCVYAVTTSYNEDFGRRNFQFPLIPKAGSDLGDVVKALAKLGGDVKKPVATIRLAKNTVFLGPEVPSEDAKFAALKKALADAKGIDWERSNRTTGLALDESGGAKFAEILAAYKKAGFALADGLDDR